MLVSEVDASEFMCEQLVDASEFMCFGLTVLDRLIGCVLCRSPLGVDARANLGELAGLAPAPCAQSSRFWVKPGSRPRPHAYQ